MKLFLAFALSLAPLAPGAPGAQAPSPAPEAQRDLTGPSPQNEPAPGSSAAPGAKSSKPPLFYKPQGVPAQPDTSTEAPPVAPEVKPYAGTLADGLEEMRALSEKNQHDEALRVADSLLAPTSFLRWKARATSEDGWRKSIVAAADPVFELLGVNGAPPPQRAAVHYARGVVLSRKGDRERSEQSFESARALAGAGELRLDAIYNLGVSALMEGESWRAKIPEISGQPAQPSPPAATPPGPSGSTSAPPDPLDLARMAYLRAKGHLVERLRADWHDDDARADTQLVQKRLKELDEIQKKREQQKKEQQDKDKKDQDDKNQDKKKDDKKPDDKSQDQKDKEQDKPEDQKPDPKDDKKDEPKKPEEKKDQKPEDAKPEEKKDDKQAQAQEPDEQVLSKEEVMRLLDILKQREDQGKKLLQQLQHARRVKVKKDW